MSVAGHEPSHLPHVQELLIGARILPFDHDYPASLNGLGWVMEAAMHVDYGTLAMTPVSEETSGPVLPLRSTSRASRPLNHVDWSFIPSRQHLLCVRQRIVESAEIEHDHAFPNKLPLEAIGE